MSAAGAIVRAKIRREAALASALSACIRLVGDANDPGPGDSARGTGGGENERRRDGNTQQEILCGKVHRQVGEAARRLGDGGEPRTGSDDKPGDRGDIEPPGSRIFIVTPHRFLPKRRCSAKIRRRQPSPDGGIPPLPHRAAGHLRFPSISRWPAGGGLRRLRPDRGASCIRPARRVGCAVPGIPGRARFRLR